MTEETIAAGISWFAVVVAIAAIVMSLAGCAIARNRSGAISSLLSLAFATFALWLALPLDAVHYVVRFGLGVIMGAALAKAGAVWLLWR
jgi:lysylphosphatidylglycerol synthetase-like protein (DUF2156 family)